MLIEHVLWNKVTLKNLHAYTLSLNYITLNDVVVWVMIIASFQWTKVAFTFLNFVLTLDISAKESKKLYMRLKDAMFWDN